MRGSILEYGGEWSEGNTREKWEDVSQSVSQWCHEQPNRDRVTKHGPASTQIVGSAWSWNCLHSMSCRLNINISTCIKTNIVCNSGDYVCFIFTEMSLIIKPSWEKIIHLWYLFSIRHCKYSGAQSYSLLPFFGQNLSVHHLVVFNSMEDTTLY